MSYFYSMNDRAEQIHTWARAKGWYDKEPRNIPEMLALIHSEVSEALECWRDGQIVTSYREDGKPEGFASELADIIIRVFDLAAYQKIDIEKEIITKMAFNETRPYRHGGKLA